MSINKNGLNGNRVKNATFATNIQRVAITSVRDGCVRAGDSAAERIKGDGNESGRKNLIKTCDVTQIATNHIFIMLTYKSKLEKFSRRAHIYLEFTLGLLHFAFLHMIYFCLQFLGTQTHKISLENGQ